MTDKPIMFSGPMVRALLDGRKTQTRRVIKPQPPDEVVRHCWYDAPVYGFTKDHDVTGDWHKVRLLGYKGDSLLVREAWRTQEAFDDLSPKQIMDEFEEEWGAPSIPTFYEADHKCDDHSIELWQQSQPGRLRASMHMPRCASRLTLIVTDVRVQRLQEISEEDALAEGIERIRYPEPGEWGWPQRKYAELWNSINGAGAWEKNPWVAAYSFEVIKANIDEVQGDD